MIAKNWMILLLLLLTMAACADKPEQKLKILGRPDIIMGDTVHHHIRDFTFINQDGDSINNATFYNKIYIADFFFISCPTICPKVKQQMLRIYERFEDNPQVSLLSHSIDPRDTVPRLKQYASKLDIEAPRWHLVTGVQDEIYEIAEDYWSIALESPDAPGGFDHSGRLLLVDKKRRLRSYANGTDHDSVSKFMDDIDILLNEYK